MQVDALVFHTAPEPFDKDVVEEPPLAVHRDAHAGSAQPIRPGKGRELAALVGVHDLGRSEAVDGLVQRLNAKVGLKRVRDAPCQHLAGVPVHDRHQIQEQDQKQRWVSASGSNSTTANAPIPPLAANLQPWFIG